VRRSRSATRQITSANANAISATAGERAGPDSAMWYPIADIEINVSE